MSQIIEYRSGNQNFRGYLAKPKHLTSETPAIVIAHTWKGLDDFCKKKAEALAELGYIALAADLYGDGITAANDEEALKLMLPLFLDRKLLRERIGAAVHVLKEQPLVDSKKVGAIGFCFGGLTVIELFRSGLDISGAVSFHGLLGLSVGEHKATSQPIAKNIQGALLILHGHEDPLVSPGDISALQQELTQAQVDWQMNIYGHAAHAFTNPEAQDASSGLVFNSKANQRSWQAMTSFFNDVFA